MPEDSQPPTVKVKGKYRKAGSSRFLISTIQVRFVVLVQVIDGTPFECYGAHTNAFPASLPASGLMLPAWTVGVAVNV